MIYRLCIISKHFYKYLVEYKLKISIENSVADISKLLFNKLNFPGKDDVHIYSKLKT